MIGEDGEVLRAVDFDALRELLGNVAESQRERYQFTWPGKRAAKEEVRKAHQQDTAPLPREERRLGHDGKPSTSKATTWKR